MFKFWTKKGDCVYEPPLGLLIEATYAVHVRPIGNLVADLLFVLNDFFSLAVTAEASRVNIDWKSAFLKEVGQFLSGPEFQVEGISTSNNFCTDR